MEQRRWECIRKAYELARSGRHADRATIEAALVPEYPEVREWLRGSIVAENLRQICELARAEQSRRTDSPYR
jgi:hypothetical protein